MSILKLNQTRSSTFKFNGFEFKKTVTLLPHYVDLTIYSVENDFEPVIKTSFTDADDFECQRDIISSRMHEYIEANSTELERLYVYVESKEFDQELKYGNNW